MFSGLELVLFSGAVGAVLLLYSLTFSPPTQDISADKLKDLLNNNTRSSEPGLRSKRRRSSSSSSRAENEVEVKLREENLSLQLKNRELQSGLQESRRSTEQEAKQRQVDQCLQCTSYQDTLRSLQRDLRTETEKKKRLEESLASMRLEVSESRLENQRLEQTLVEQQRIIKIALTRILPNKQSSTFCQDHRTTLLNYVQRC